MVVFSKYVKMYENYKVRNGLGEGVSRNEIKELRESYSTESKKEKILESRNAMSNADSSYARKAAIREAKFKARRLAAIRESKLGTDKFSVNEKLNEARVAYYKAKRFLREDDMAGVADQTQIATQAVDAVSANPQVVSPEVISMITDLKAKIDSLATSVGAVADTGITPEADPNADVAAQTGQPLEDAAAQAAPMVESAAMKAVKARIAERKAEMAKKAAQVAALNESAATDQIMAGLKASTPVSIEKVSVDTKESPLPKAPTQSEMTKGTGKGVVRWPNKPITKDPSDALLGKGFVQNESVEKPLDELAVDRVLSEKKLNFKELYSDGITYRR